MRVQAFGTFDARRHPRVGVLIDGLRERGVVVDVCNEPLGFTTAERVRMLRQPWRLPLAALRLVGLWARLGWRSRALPRPDAVLVGYLGHLDVLLARALHPRTPVVHDMLVFGADTARDRGSGGAAQAVLRLLDRAAVAASDLVLVDTEEHRAMLPAGTCSLVVPVGAPRAWLSEPPQPREGRVRVVFYGLFTPLQGAPVIGRALALLDGAVHVTMVGQGQDLDETRRRAGAARGVTWREWVAPETLPSLVADHDVCLGIFSEAGKGTRVVPNKVFQGAAAGCAVVTSDTPPQRRVLGDAAVLVPPGDPAALADALRGLAADPARLLALREAAWTLARRCFMPDEVARPLVSWLAERGTR